MKQVVVFISIAVCFCSCVRYSQGFDAYFCTTTEAEIKSYLYIDDEKIGILPYMSNAPSAKDRSRYGRLLRTNLSARSHRVKVLDEHGNVLYSGKLKAGRHGRSSSVSTSTKGKRWSTKVKAYDKILIADLQY